MWCAAAFYHAEQAAVALQSQQRQVQVRVMPNMPCLIRQAASAFVMGNNTSEQDLQRVLMLLSSVGAPAASVVPVGSSLQSSMTPLCCAQASPPQWQRARWTRLQASAGLRQPMSSSSSRHWQMAQSLPACHESRLCRSSPRASSALHAWCALACPPLHLL